MREIEHQSSANCANCVKLRLTGAKLRQLRQIAPDRGQIAPNRAYLRLTQYKIARRSQSKT